MTESGTPYSIRVDAAVTPAVSRELWLVTWLLWIPHYVGERLPERAEGPPAQPSGRPESGLTPRAAPAPAH
jgi:hypothetical protein